MPQTGARTRPLWVAVGVLLLIGIVVPLLVGVYDREDPTLWGFPFYYWFQFLLIPVVSLLTVTAYQLAKAGTRRDRAARGLPAAPGEETPR